EHFEPLCPWCVADGSAASRFRAQFTDVGDGAPEDVPQPVLEQLTRRTPGYTAWQSERWLFHCGDACAYLGAVDAEQLAAHPEALEMVRDAQREFEWSEADIDDYVASLGEDSSPSAYLFRCLRCGTYQAYSDFL
ncbi:MAG TPA: CbrC family protein, partial [Acidimicrobiales bacterium]|nr:CbrC family protein [Acidimicrobiales bacterium]